MKITLDDVKKLYKMASAYHTHLLNEDIKEADKCVEVLNKFCKFFLYKEIETLENKESKDD